MSGTLFKNLLAVEAKYSLHVENNSKDLGKISPPHCNTTQNAFSIIGLKEVNLSNLKNPDLHSASDVGGISSMQILHICEFLTVPIFETIFKNELSNLDFNYINEHSLFSFVRNYFYLP